MISYSFYENDNRVRRYAETLTERGSSVDVFALRQKNQTSFETLNGVNLYRIRKRLINEKGKLSYLYRLITFLFLSSIYVTKYHLKKRYDLIHVHSIPDFEVFAAWLPKLMGAKIILDIHDLVPEFYANKFNKSQNSFIYKILILIEKTSIAFSNHTIISNHIWAKKLLTRSSKEHKCTVILNYPDPKYFYQRPRIRKDNKFIIIYPGSLNSHQGLDIATKAFVLIKDETPEVEFHIYGKGEQKEYLSKLIVEHGLQKRVLLKDVLPIEKIAEVMANADLGVVPKRNDFFGREAFSTKILEFMALGVPVIVSKTEIDTYYFDDSVVKYFEAGDEEDLARCMLLMIKNTDLRKRLIENALNFVKEYTWDKKKDIYLNLIDSLVENSNKNSRSYCL